MLQPSVFNAYKIDLYFPKHNLAIKVDEKSIKTETKKEENERENTIKEHFGCKFIRINTD